MKERVSPNIDPITKAEDSESGGPGSDTHTGTVGLDSASGGGDASAPKEIPARNPEKTTIALVTMYNATLDRGGDVIGIGSLGVRIQSAVLQRAGHRAPLIFFRDYNCVREHPDMPEGEHLLQPIILPGRVFKLRDEDVEILLDTIRDSGASMVGISVTSVIQKAAVVVTEAIRKELKIPVIWGGPHATIAPEESIRHCDAICIGPGEDAILEVANRDASGLPWDDVENLWVRQMNGTVRKNPLRKKVTPFEMLPLPEMDARKMMYIDSRIASKAVPMDPDKFQFYIPLSSYGCPFGCTYCFHPVMRATYPKGIFERKMPVERFIEELREAKKNYRNLRQIQFWEPNFTIDQEWLDSFAPLYKEHIGIPFFNWENPGYFRPESAAKLKEAGCVAVNIGVQSASPGIRELFKRNESDEHIIRTVKSLQDAGIEEIRLEIIIDNPYETDEDVRHTFELLMRLQRPFQIMLFTMSWLSGTELTKRALADGIISEENMYWNEVGAGKDPVKFFSYDRPRERQFWYLMYHLTQRDLISKKNLRRLSRSRFLKRHPGLLLKLVNFIMRIRRVK